VLILYGAMLVEFNVNGIATGVVNGSVTGVTVTVENPMTVHRVLLLEVITCRGISA
jgi:hypothetical protein